MCLTGRLNTVSKSADVVKPVVDPGHEFTNGFVASQLAEEAPRRERS